MRALVTGGTGFVGSHLVEALLRGGYVVTTLVRSPAKAAWFGSRVRLVVGDLHNHSALEQATAEQDLIFHVAGVISARNKAEFLRANRDGTAHLVEAVNRQVSKPRFLLVSSLAAVGPSAPGAPLSGDVPPRPVTEYGRSKLAAEEIVRASSLPWTILRPPIVYGPRDREILRIFKAARVGLAPVFGDGSQELSAVYAPDLAEALIAAARSGATRDRVYYACHPEVCTSAGFALAVARALGRSIRVIRVPRVAGRGILALTGAVAGWAGRATILTADKANEFFQPAWTADPSALTRDAGWSAAHDLERGLAETVHWYREARWL